MKHEFNIIIEQDEDGYYIGSVSELPGCHTQAKSLDELKKRIIEAIELYLELKSDWSEMHTKFVGIQKVEINIEKA